MNDPEKEPALDDARESESANIETYDTLAKIIDYPLLAAELSDEQIAEGCRLAREYGIASVVVRPSDVDEAVRWMQGSGIAVGSTVGYPDGASTTGAKLYEGRDLLRRGARELDMTLNIGKLISRQFQYVETELMQMAKSCAEAGVKLKVTLGSRYLTDDLKIIACKICKRIEVPYLSLDYSLADFALLQPLLKDRIEISVANGVETLAEALEARDAGCTRLSAIGIADILENWKTHLAQLAAGMAAEG
jgi:deoxyribose-phosphate aldolase